ncbi:hypothetical protein BD770DRAFT_393635 [Pilaira anomala]|nr:hypothetical protein BD770DRAFT_393635 [Pilaira anomala]
MYEKKLIIYMKEKGEYMMCICVLYSNMRKKKRADDEKNETMREDEPFRIMDNDFHDRILRHLLHTMDKRKTQIHNKC